MNFPVDEFYSLAPWVNAIDFEGRRWVGVTANSIPTEAQRTVRKSRVNEFSEFFRDVSVLELGALEGNDTMALALISSNVLAVEGREENLKRASFVIDLHGISNVTLIQADLDGAPLIDFGHFDVTYCTGLLYHLRYPTYLLNQIARVSDSLFLQTHYWVPREEGIRSDDHSGAWCTEDYPETRLRGLGAQSRWLSRPFLFDALRSAGFEDICVLADDQLNGAPSITIVAKVGSSPSEDLEAK
jgi:SAM-dependent methyltransferase